MRLAHPFSNHISKRNIEGTLVFRAQTCQSNTLYVKSM